jgi:MoaA/NifB/PqqE/SkfB family radical SAM enzyme
MKLAWSHLYSWFLPKFSWVQVEVTSFCNASCLYCPQTAYRDVWQKRHLPLPSFQKLLPALNRTHLTYLQGWGEPFLHPDFFTMLALAKKTGCRVGTTTNGMLLDREKCDLLVAAGLDVLSFSLAGLDANNDCIRQGTSFAKVLEAMATLNRAKDRAGRSLPQIHLAYMLLRSGLGDLDQLPLALKGLGIDQVVISTLDFAAAPELAGECLPGDSPEDYQELSLRLENLRETAKGHGLKVFYRLPPPDGRLSLCPEQVQGALVVSGAGEVTPCVFTNLPVSRAVYAAPGGEVPYRRLVFGNINEQPLPAIWRQPAYANFRRSFFTGRLAEPCRHCRKLGSARLNN